jgi:hypothetical protein
MFATHTGAIQFRFVYIKINNNQASASLVDE